ERTAEPSRERYGEAHFRPVQDLPRQPRLHRLLEEPLAFLSVDLHRRWKSCEPFNERMIHEGLTHLERVRHAGPVDLRVDIADQVCLEVEILDEGKRVFRAGR